MKNIILLLITWVGIIIACNNQHSENRPAAIHNDSTVIFAKGFELNNSGLETTIVVSNPWQHASNIKFTYLLCDTFKDSYALNDYTWAIKTPVKRVICLSTTHIGFIAAIDQTGSICGISGRKYVVHDSVRKGLAQKTVFDVGYDENLNYELILKLRPDVVFAYGVNVSITNTIKKLKELGIPVILIGEYLEEDPLAKMEWIKVFAALFGKAGNASTLFHHVSEHYLSLKKLASSENYTPTVLLGLPWNGNWFVSGSKSYIARLIKDAGGKYIWDQLDFNESRPFALETIYENALSATYWINPGETRSIRDIISVDARFEKLPSLKKGKVFNNDRLMSETGGNAFFESGVVEPDIILSDLISILHPQLLPSYQLKYYRKIQ